jgi:hypothetical protein
MLKDNPTVVGAKFVQNPATIIKAAVAVAQRDLNSVICEPDDIEVPVAIDIAQKPRVILVPVVGAKGVQNPATIIKAAIAIAQRDMNPVIREPNNIRVPIAIEIDKEARMGIDAPASTRPIAEQNKLFGGKRAIAVAQRDMNPIIREPNNIGAPIAINIGKKPRVIAVPAVVGAKGVQNPATIIKAGIAIAQRDMNPVIREPNNIGMPIVIKIEK